MKVFINGYSIGREPIVAYIDNIVYSTEIFFDRHVYEKRMVDVKQINDITNALNKLGSPVKKITIDCHFADFDTPYYKRLPESVINKLWNYCSWRCSKELDVKIKGNRLYTQVDGYDVILPKEMCTDYDNKTLLIHFYV